MTRYQLVTLALAVAVTASLVGVGISIAEGSIAGIVICLLAAFFLMGAGFRYKKKHMG